MSESPLSSSHAWSQRWRLFVCHHAWLQTHMNVHTVTQQAKAPGHLGLGFLFHGWSWKSNCLNILWHPSIFPIVPCLSVWARGLLWATDIFTQLGMNSKQKPLTIGLTETIMLVVIIWDNRKTRETSDSSPSLSRLWLQFHFDNVKLTAIKHIFIGNCPTEHNLYFSND